MRRLNCIIREFSGSLGDLPLLFTFLVGLTQFCHFNPSQILIWSGIAHILVGIVFKIPLSYQPMKAMGLYAIASSVSQGDLLMAGFLSGFLLLVLNFLGILERLYRAVPLEVIRGIQCGLGLLFFKKSFQLIFPALSLHWIHAVPLIAIVVFSTWLRRRQYYLSLAVFAAGTLWLATTDTALSHRTLLTWPEKILNLPSLSFGAAVLPMIFMQLPLTIANSILATKAKADDYFPRNGVTISRLAFSVGLMNLLTCPLGGMPACHGVGGLAAQVRFGARTGYSIISLGFLKILTALFFGGAVLTVAQSFPKQLLGLLFFFPAFDLCSGIRDIRNRKMLLTFTLTTLFSLLVNAGIGLVIGMGMAAILNRSEALNHNKEKAWTS